MTKSTKLLFQVGEETFEPTGEVLAQYEADQLTIIDRDAELQAKAQARLALLSRLGITEEEALLILG